MKKGLIVLTLLLMLGMCVPTLAQKHRHTPQGKELVDTTNHTSAIDAFSDTTSVDSNTTTHVSLDWDSEDEDVDLLVEKLGKVAETINGSGFAWFAWVIAILVIIFVFLLVLSPFIFVILIVYLVSRNRKQKINMAQMAMQNGQPIPEQLLEKRPQEEINDEYQKGLRQCFVGVGLGIFLGYAAGEIGFGIGALVFFIGLGKVIAAKTTVSKKQREEDLNGNNDLNQQNYD